MIVVGNTGEISRAKKKNVEGIGGLILIEVVVEELANVN
jgi:hypothetical protein